MTETAAYIDSQLGLSGDDISFRLLAESTPDLIEILDKQARRLFLNSSFRELFPGPDQVLGTRPYDDKNLVNGTVMRDMLAKILLNGKAEFRTFERIMPDGSSRFFECRITAIPVTGADESASAVMLISSDITDRIRLSERLHEYENRIKIAEEIGMMGSWEYDFSKDKFIISEHFARIFGLPSGLSLLGKEEILGLIHPDDRNRMAELRSEQSVGDSIYEEQYKIVRSDGGVRVIHSRWRVERDDTNQPYRSMGLCQDITDRINAENTAFKIEEHFQLLVENAQDFAIFLLDLDGFVSSWNQGAERVLGYKTDEILGRHYSCFYPPEPWINHSYSMQLAIATRTGKFESTNWRVRKDGDTFWANGMITRLMDKSENQIGYLKIIHDMTKQKCTEDLLRSQADRLKINARRLVELQETERQHLARELHDLVGPNLTALGINLQLITSHLSQGTKDNVPEVLKDSVEYVRSTVDALRYIIGELRPHSLEDFGLRAGLRSHVVQFMKLTGIKVNIDETDLHAVIPDFIKMSLFRITQEALNNIAKHAQASMVDISIEHAPQKIGLSIKDNGIGFDKNRIETDKPGQNIGLVIIRERAEAIGANFNLETGPGKGVHIYVECQV